MDEMKINPQFKDYFNPQASKWILNNWYGFWACDPCKLSIDSTTAFTMMEDEILTMDDNNNIICFRCKKRIMHWIDPIAEKYILKV